MISELRSIITNAGGTPTRYDDVGLLREMILAAGGTPTQYAVVPLLRELIVAVGGTPTQYFPTALLRELVAALGAAPTSYNPDTLWSQVLTTGLSSYASWTFAFAPKTANYWVGGTKYAAVSNLTGYAYSRLGEQGAANAAGVVSWFNQGVPVINSAGFDALGGFTVTEFNSQDFTAASWTKTNMAVTANTASAPDNSVTMDKAVPSAVNATHSIASTKSFFSGSVYTMSVVAKKAEWDKVELYANPGSALGAVFDLTNGTVATASGASGYIVPLANGTYRCVIVFTASASASGATEVRPRNSTTFNTTDLGDGTSGLHLWQFQTIDRAWPDGGPYIRTGAGSANVGAMSLLLTSTFSIAAASSFVILLAINLKNLASARGLMILDNGTTAARASLEVNTNGSITVYGDNSSIGAETPTVPLTTGRMVLALRRQGGNWKRYSLQNGNSFVGADTAWALSADLTQLNIGTGLNNQAFGTIEFLGIKSGTFSDAEVTSLMSKV